MPHVTCFLNTMG